MQGYEQVLCSILRGVLVAWPASGEWSVDDFFEACRQHGVAGLVYHSLVQSAEFSAFPDSFCDKLKEHYLQSSALELRRVNGLAGVLRECSSCGITPLLLKGAALSYTHYPMPGLRERSDTDLFIRVKDIRLFQQVMVKMGYSVECPVYKSHQFTCVNPLVFFPDSLDVHWRISNTPRFAKVMNFDEAFAHSVPVPELGKEARALSAENALLLACMHLEGNPQHDAERLIWVYDLHLVASSMEREDLVEFARLAVSKQVQDVCYAALKKSVKCFETALPEEMMQLLSTPLPLMNLLSIIEQSSLGLLWDDLKVLPGISQKLSLLQELFFPPKQYLWQLYGTSRPIWLPWLYLRYTFGRVVMKLTLQ